MVLDLLVYGSQTAPATSDHLLDFSQTTFSKTQDLKTNYVGKFQLWIAYQKSGNSNNVFFQIFTP